MVSSSFGLASPTSTAGPRRALSASATHRQLRGQQGVASTADNTASAAASYSADKASAAQDNVDKASTAPYDADALYYYADALYYYTDAPYNADASYNADDSYNADTPYKAPGSHESNKRRRGYRSSHKEYNVKHHSKDPLPPPTKCTPSPPPPPPELGGVTPTGRKPFGSRGAWVGSNPASFDNAWLASYLSDAVYRRDGEDDEYAFAARFNNEMTAVDGATASM